MVSADTGAPTARLPRRLRREAKTVEVMIRMNCRDSHGEPGNTRSRPASDDPEGLCPDCAALLEYSLARIADCRFGEAKPTCARCTVHCFRPTMRERIKAAMRHSGPRMTYRHPYLAARHLLDRRREPVAGGKAG